MEHRQKVTAQVEALLRKAGERYGVKFVTPLILWDLAGKFAGRAYLTHKIRFNEQLYLRNVEEYEKNIIPHEVGHLIVNRIYGRGNVRSHGKEWQDVVRFIGGNAARTHNMDVIPARVHTKISMVCACGCGKQVNIGPVRYRRFLRGVKYRICPKGWLIRQVSVPVITETKNAA